MMPRTIIEKIWDQHIVKHGEGKPDLLYIDLHLIHEVTSPQAFEGLRQREERSEDPKIHLRQWTTTSRLSIVLR